jgi:hypothetical protein
MIGNPARSVQPGQQWSIGSGRPGQPGIRSSRSVRSVSGRRSMVRSGRSVSRPGQPGRRWSAGRRRSVFSRSVRSVSRSVGGQSFRSVFSVSGRQRDGQWSVIGRSVSSGQSSRSVQWSSGRSVSVSRRSAVLSSWSAGLFTVVSYKVIKN